LTALLSVLSSFLVGLVLTVAPWTSLWDSNWLLQPWPAARALLMSGFARGAVTGLGLVNLVVALSDVRARLLHAAERR
jgi:hypothetical protein